MSKGKSHLEFDDELDVTPLIDVGFLLQIFFMVTSTIAMASAIVMPAAVNVQAPDLTKSIPVTIFHNESGPELYLSDGERENGPVTVDDVIPYVQEGYNTGKNIFLIKADRDVASGFVDEVARAAANVEGLQFYFAVVDKPPE
jgi:biopolymer transport protein ExbD